MEGAKRIFFFSLQLDKIAGQAFVKGNNGFVTQLLHCRGAVIKPISGFGICSGCFITLDKRKPPVLAEVGLRRAVRRGTATRVKVRGIFFLSRQYVRAHLLSLISI